MMYNHHLSMEHVMTAPTNTDPRAALKEVDRMVKAAEKDLASRGIRDPRK